jgi:hypothetical protein
MKMPKVIHDGEPENTESIDAWAVHGMSILAGRLGKSKDQGTTTWSQRKKTGSKETGFSQERRALSIKKSTLIKPWRDVSHFASIIYESEIRALSQFHVI